jgi:hypothetical protein
MLHTMEWRWQHNYSPQVSSGPPITGVVGTSASGLDLVISLTVQLRQNQADTAGHYLLQSAALPEAELHPQNRRALALLRDWMAEPDDLGDDWWDAFEQDLKQNRFSLREPE